MKTIFFASTALVTGAVSAAQGSHTAGPVSGSLTHNIQATPDFVALPPKGSGDVSVKLLIERTPLQVAPESVFFEATDLAGWNAPFSATGYNAQDHDLIYLWDFGDDGATFTAPTNVLAQWKDANKGYGRKVAHVYQQPGTYTPSVLIIEPSSGKNITITLDPITVADPDVVYSGSKTIFVSANSSHPNRPAGSKHSPTASGAFTLGAGTDCRIMFARGETFTTGKLDCRSLKRFMLCAAPGSGAKPVIRKTGTTYEQPLMEIHYDYTSSQIIVDGLQFEGAWDSTTETGGDKAGPCFKLHAQSAVNMLVTNCESSGFFYTMLWLTQKSGDAAKAGRFCLHNTFVTNWQDYGLYMEACGRIALLGNRLSQHVDALSGGPKTYDPRLHNGHGPMRFQLFIPHHVQIDGNDMFTRCGWFPNVPEVATEQPCIRANMAQRRDSMYHVSRCSMEGGDVSIVNGPMNGNIAPVLSPMVVEMCYFVGSYQTRYFVITSSSGLTVRNTVGIRPNLPVFSGKDWISFVTVAGHDTGAPVKVHNNTYINLSTDGEGEPFVDKETGSFTVMEADNITHAPRFNPSVTDFAPLDQTPRWTPRHKGYKNKGDASFHTEYATPADTVWNAAPLEKSPVLGAAVVEDAVYVDLAGQVRPAYPSVGALEMQD
ncbi:hypothetical protein [uncultured Jannaschia sp.]|uniref:PKD domain-containing protein n=1 Tax=uncultured Jannaschia sp. TaxID=293347 RepID=UPI00260F3E7E|nr:hypothetical protein [uncultured Jannaschia sp.]